MLTSALRPSLREYVKISLMSRKKKKGGDDFDGTRNCQIISNPIYFNCRIRMSMDSVIYKCCLEKPRHQQ